ncbi:MAG: S53 family peptidase [Fimbriimonas ginsengisoli]|uniref:S53 family peptidase n=1 Tax=Fimbriimonas ginsengisoli TaxID=1005039 RepID=A0A931LT47_FIMGI|nr:S53 family peptidase [Fimbriimonas ginsengisoli]
MRKFAHITSVAVSTFALAGYGGMVRGEAGRTISLAAAQRGRVFVPDTSVDRPGEAGLSMHTNHLIRANRDGAPVPAVTPSGFSPSQIRTAYGVPSSGGSGVIVIVDAFDDRYALADFNAFSAQFGLPQETSTNVTASTNTVLQIVYAQVRKPRFNAGWSQEEALDIEWAHAMAPGAKIVLVEAASNSNSNLYAADDLAATIAGAHQCSNSWSGGESSGELSSDSHFNHASMTYFFSSGDTGGARGYPAASPNVVAVGGTSLFTDGSGNRTSETVWSGSGCGPSGFEPRPAYQNVISGIVGSARGICDISAVADPNTGVAVRWNGGWYVFGGTSVSCPVIAGIVNSAGANRGGPSAENTLIYGGLGGAIFFDVTSGSAGSFSAAAGWDFPTGVGSPKGTAGL